MNAMTGSAPSVPSVTVAVITYRRPEHVRICLAHLAAQTRRPDQVLVVDASPDGATRAVVAEEGAAVAAAYLRNDAGAGTMATSRAIALAATTSEILAFLDDDAYADPDWLERLVRPYADPTIAAVGGRQRRGQPGEESPTAEPVGRLLPDGRLSGGFTVVLDHDLDVDHLLGANMSLRAAVLRDLGGIRDHYPGTCLREESDIYLRLRRAGWRVVYTPAAVVTHVAAPYATGARFDLRYHYYGHRNHVVLLGRTQGLRATVTRRYLAATLREDLLGGLRAAARSAGDRALPPRPRARRVAGTLARTVVATAGTTAGITAAVRLRWAAGPVSPPAAR